MAGTNDDRFDGGEGSDTVDFTNARRMIQADLQAGSSDGQGIDTLSSIENLVGGIRDDILAGDANANVLAGGPGVDQLTGREGDDTIIGNDGDDIMDGGGGTDLASYALALVPITADLEAGFATGEGSDNLLAIEGVVGGESTDFLRGDDASNPINGGPGNDVIEGRAGDDQLDGGKGTDYVDGGTGNDGCHNAESELDCES
jgi:Ca2+-binding RTX toxin-like protein